MSRSSKIVRFTFWMNNISYLLLFMTYWFGLSIVTTRLAIIPAILCMTGLAMVVTYEFWYLWTKLGVTSMKDIFYFVDDEREKYIAMRVSSQLIQTGSIQLIILFVLTGLLTNLPTIGVREFGMIMMVAIAIAMYWLNIKYYVLWNKYAKQ